MMLCSAFGQPRHCLPRARSGKRRQLLACWADQFTAALLCAILRSRDRCCGGERKSRTRYHINHLEPADASDATRTSCLIVCPSTIFEIPLPSSAIAKMPPKSKSSKPQKTLEEKVEAAMADARAAGLPEGWTVKFNVSNQNVACAVLVLALCCGYN